MHRPVERGYYSSLPQTPAIHFLKSCMTILCLKESVIVSNEIHYHVIDDLPWFAEMNTVHHQFHWNRLPMLKNKFQCLGPTLSYYEKYKETLWRHGL